MFFFLHLCYYHLQCHPCVYIFIIPLSYCHLMCLYLSTQFNLYWLHMCVVIFVCLYFMICWDFHKFNNFYIWCLICKYMGATSFEQPSASCFQGHLAWNRCQWCSISVIMFIKSHILDVFGNRVLWHHSFCVVQGHCFYLRQWQWDTTLSLLFIFLFSIVIYFYISYLYLGTPYVLICP